MKTIKTILQVKPTKLLEKATAAEVDRKDEEVDERKIDALLSGESGNPDEDSKKDST